MALQGSVGEIRTNLEDFSLKNDKKIRTVSQPQTKFTDSYKKRVYLIKTVLKKTCNCIFNMEKADLEEL